MVLNWKRYCYKRGDEQSIQYKNGYVAESQSSTNNPLLQTFASVQEYKCLVLLGEPGIGKSQVMTETADLLQSQINPSDALLELDLGTYGQEGRLIEELFNNEIFRNWEGGQYNLYLFLDSLDEGMLQIHVLSNLLANRFKKIDISRLYLRIACRTGSFPKGLEETLHTLWKKEQVQFYQIAPLTESNVREAARSYGLNDDEFINTLGEHKAEAFAIRPVTLNMLLRIIKRKEKLPSSAYEIYKIGCKFLCEENNNNRRDKPGISGRLSSMRKVEIASRIAAISLLCNKRMLFTGNESWLSTDEELSVFSELDIPNNDLEETLRTGLFISNGIDRMVWAHQTYLEFLAAEFIMDHNWNTVQIMNLTLHPSDHEGRFIHQLHELVAWLASKRTDIFSEVLEREPNLLFLTDPSLFNIDQRTQALKKLLSSYSEDSHFASYIKLSYFSELNYPGIEEYLITILRSEDYSIDCRQLTVYIAVELQLTELSPELLVLAKESHGDLKRSLLKGYLKLCPKEKRKEAFEAVQITGEDPDVIGLVVTELFPEYLTINQAFSLIANARLLSENVKRFVSKHVMELDETQTLGLLIWIEKHLNEITTDTFKALYDSALAHSFTFWENDTIRKEILNLVCKNNKFYGVYYFNKQYTNDIQRGFLYYLKENTEVNLMFLDLLYQQEEVEIGPWIKRHIENNLITKEMDINLIKKYICSTKNPILWTALILMLLNPNKKEDQPFLLDNLIFNYTERFFPSIPLSEAALWKEIHNKLNPHKIEDLDRQTDVNVIENLLQQFEKGELDCWYKIAQEIRMKEDSWWFQFDDEKELTQCEGWIKLDSSTQARFIEGAKKFLLSDPRPSKDSDIGSYLYTLELIYNLAEQILIKSIIPSISDFWIEAITGLNHCSLNALNSLTALAYETNPSLTKHYVLENTKRLSRGWGVKHVVYEQIKICWDKEMYHALQQIIKSDDIRLEVKSCIIDVMLWLEWDETSKFLMDMLNNRYNSVIPRLVIIECCCTYIERLNNKTWDYMWQILKEDIQFREAVFEHFNKTFRNYSFLTDSEILTEDRLVELYIWLEQYPVYKSYILEGWQGSILRNLVDRKTIEAGQAIIQLRISIPESREVKHAWETIRRDFLTRKWNPPLPKVITGLEFNKGKMPVLNEMQLKEKVDELNNQKIKPFCSFEKLLEDIVKACLLMQGDRMYKNASENGRNTFITFLLEMAGYYAKDQTLWGESYEGKASGEIDIFIRNIDGEPFSIIEALNLNSLRKDYIDLHLNKIFSYDRNGLKHNFILIYSSAKNFLQLWDKYINYLQVVKLPYDMIEFNENQSFGYSELRVGQSAHLRHDKTIYLNHIAINLTGD